LPFCAAVQAQLAAVRQEVEWASPAVTHDRVEVTQIGRVNGR